MKRTLYSRCISNTLLYLFVLMFLHRLSKCMAGSVYLLFLIAAIAFFLSISPHLLCYSLLNGQKMLWSWLFAPGSEAGYIELQRAFLAYLEKEKLEFHYLKQILALCIAAEIIFSAIYVLVIYWTV